MVFCWCPAYFVCPYCMLCGKFCFPYIDSTSQPEHDTEDDGPATGGDDGPATGGDDFSGCPSDCESDTAGTIIYGQTRLRVAGQIPLGPCRARVRAMAFPNLEWALCVVPFLDGPTLQQWKAICRRFDCHETDRAIKETLLSGECEEMNIRSLRHSGGATRSPSTR